MSEDSERISAAIIGAGPAGLAAAEMLVEHGVSATIFEAMPSPARKFLMAGKSGLNLTKDEPQDAFSSRIGCPELTPVMKAFGPAEMMAWAEGLGEPVFTGSSRRVFPVAMKASPLLRKWLESLRDQGASLRTRWSWKGWDGDKLVFRTQGGLRHVQADVTVLALGGASWPRLGSDGAWVPVLRAEGAGVRTLAPSNMGFEVPWSEHFKNRFAGTPVKGIGLRVGEVFARGDVVVTGYGLEGGPLYEISSALRDALDRRDVDFTIDLLPDMPERRVAERLQRRKGKASMANHLRRTLGLMGAKAGLLREARRVLPESKDDLAALIKALPLTVSGPRPIAEAISTAGGIAWDCLDKNLMLKIKPSVFAAGEMLDWDAPTGGYLLTTCLATGRHAGQGAARYLAALK